LYSDYSFDLIEKIQNRIHEKAPIDYQQGLTGIGVAFEFMVQNGFIDADTDDLLEDFDKQLFSTLRLALLTELDGDDSWISLFPNYLNKEKNEPLPL